MPWLWRELTVGFGGWGLWAGPEGNLVGQLGLEGGAYGRGIGRAGQLGL